MPRRHTKLRIYSSSLREECEVFGVAVSTEDKFPKEKRIVFYIEDKDSRGLSVEEIGNARVTDASLSMNFRFHQFSDSSGFIFMWDYFKDLEQLGRVIDFDLKAIAEFEEARSSLPF
jgi:hypothetical protein